MNISAPFIHRPVGTALLTVVVVLRVAEFLAEKWGQKNRVGEKSESDGPERDRISRKGREGRKG